LFAFVNPTLEKEALRRVSWDQIGPTVTIPAWKSIVTEYALLLQGITAEAVPDFTQKLPEIGSRMRDPRGTLLTHEQRTQRAGHLVASALALALLEKRIGNWNPTRPVLLLSCHGKNQRVRSHARTTRRQNQKG